MSEPINKLISKVFKDTFTHFGINKQTAKETVCIIILGFYFFYSRSGETETIMEFNTFIDFVIKPFGIIFLWNLICAPYRLAREREEALKGDLDVAHKQLAQKEIAKNKEKDFPQLTQTLIDVLIIITNNKPALHDFIKEKMNKIEHNETDFNNSLDILFHNNMIRHERKIKLNKEEYDNYGLTNNGSNCLQKYKNSDEYKNSKAHDIKMKLWLNKGGFGRLGKGGKSILHNYVFWAEPEEIPESWFKVMEPYRL